MYYAPTEDMDIAKLRVVKYDPDTQKWNVDENAEIISRWNKVMFKTDQLGVYMVVEMK